MKSWWACVAAASLVSAGALLGLALDRKVQVVRVCCLARFPARGDTVRVGRICVDVPDSPGRTRATGVSDAMAGTTEQETDR